MKLFRCLFLILCLTLLSCSKDKSGNSYSKEKESFGPKGQDTVVEVKKDAPKKINWNSYSGWISTHEFMQSLVTLFEFAPESKVPYEMLDRYYSNPNTTTMVNINSGTYVEAALGIYGPDIFNSINVSNVKNHAAIINAFKSWNVRIPKNLSPAQIMSRLIGLLKELPSHLVKNDVSQSVADGVAKSIGSYIQTLNVAADRLSFLKTEKTEGMLFYNITIIRDTLSDLIESGIVTQESMSASIESLEFPTMLSVKFNEKTHKSIASILFSILQQKRHEFLLRVGKEDVSNLTSIQKAELIAEFPISMQEFASTFIAESEEALAWYKLAEFENFLSPIRSFYLGRLISKLEETDANTMLLDIEYQVSVTAYNQLNNILLQKAQDLPQIVEKVVLTQFSALEHNFYYNFYNQIKKIASERIKEDLLSGEGKFPGVEGKYVFWPIEQTASTYQSHFLTGGKEIGSAIQANIFFLENIKNTTVESADKKFKTYTFSLLNRLLAIFGYRNFHGVLTNSLHQRFSPTESASFDIYSYDIEPGVYALPDNLQLSSGYDVSTENHQKLVQTVAGKASLIKASAKMLDFFADYNHNSFDDIFSTFQFEGFSVFPKEPIFDLSLGSMSILLRNLTKGEAIFFDMSGNPLASTGDIYTDAKGAGAVALLSRTETGFSDSIQGEDTADYIIALSSLLDSARRLPQAKVGLLSKLTDGKQADLDTLMNLLPSLRKLQYGLGLFLYNKMVKDQWLVNSYFIKDQSASEKEYNLSRQLKLIQAMLSIYNEWKSDIFLWAAVDGYYALNKELLSKENIGYVLSAGFPMFEVTESWKTLLELKKVIESLPDNKREWWSSESELQLNRLLNYYKQNWQELSNVQ